MLYIKHRIYLGNPKSGENLLSVGFSISFNEFIFRIYYSKGTFPFYNKNPSVNSSQENRFTPLQVTRPVRTVQYNFLRTSTCYTTLLCPSTCWCWAEIEAVWTCLPLTWLLNCWIPNLLCRANAHIPCSKSNWPLLRPIPPNKSTWVPPWSSMVKINS